MLTPPFLIYSNYCCLLWSFFLLFYCPLTQHSTAPQIKSSDNSKRNNDKSKYLNVVLNEAVKQFLIVINALKNCFGVFQYNSNLHTIT